MLSEGYTNFTFKNEKKKLQRVVQAQQTAVTVGYALSKNHLKSLVPCYLPSRGMEKKAVQPLIVT